ncbi:MAG: phosphotransferase [Mycobacteriales bacterium]
MTAGLEQRLRDWVPEQRWYADKGRVITSLSVEVVATLPGDEPTVHVVVVSFDYAAGPSARYQLLVAERADLPSILEHAVIGSRDGDGPAPYDALHDIDATARLFERFTAGTDVGAVTFGGGLSAAAMHGRLMGGEQSNSSVVYGDEYILKAFRKLSPGVNPDLEVGRALAAAGCEVIAPPLAWYELDSGDAEPTTLGQLQPYFRGGTDGWLLAITSVRDLLADPGVPAAEAGGDFAPEAERLGEMTGILHRDLRAALGTTEPATGSQRTTAAQMLRRLDEAVVIAPGLREFVPGIRAVFEKYGAAQATGPLQRIHGDYHLGQVLRTDAGWVALDFEGEPAKTLEERRTPMSPLRDVAGMLRSFDYASRHHLVEQARPAPDVVERAAEWTERNRSAFCDGYARALGLDPRDAGPLLAAYELDKAVYEVVYETRNRPTWAGIPLSSIARLVHA